MMSTNEPEGRTLWFCRWNWCAQVFENGPGLLDHLKKEHFGRILQVEKTEWDVYLRCNEGQSGLTDSLLKTTRTQSNGLSTDSSETHIAHQAIAQDVLMQDRRMSVQPSEPSQTAEEDSASLPYTQPVVDRGGGPSSYASPPAIEEHSAIVHTKSRSFADCDAASSPITTPLASPLPPSPTLHSRVVDAINSVADTPRNAHPLPLPRRAPPRLPNSPTPLPLPRRARLPAPPSSQGSSIFGASQNASNSLDSSTSAHDVETQLTQGVASVTASPAAVHTDSQWDAHDTIPSLSYPDDPYPPICTQAPYDSQVESGTNDHFYRRPASPDNVEVPPVSSSTPHRGSQSPMQVESRPVMAQTSFASQFSSGRLVLRLDSEPPAADMMDVDGVSAPLQLQTQATYSSQ